MIPLLRALKARSGPHSSMKLCISRSPSSSASDSRLSRKIRKSGVWSTRMRRSRMTRSSGRRRGSPVRSVSCGLSLINVPLPVTTASTRCRIPWTTVREASEVIHCDSPCRVAILPSTVMASFRMPKGFPLGLVFDECFVQLPGFGFEDSGSRFRSRLSGAEPFRVRSLRDWDPSIALTARLTPALISASAQGPVRPWWDQGSRDV